MKSVIAHILTSVTSMLLCIGCTGPGSPLPTAANKFTVLDIDRMGIHVSADQQRQYSFTDKKSAFWYGMTHTDDWNDWYAGWNIAKKRLLSDYTLTTDTSTLFRSTADVTVYPYKIHRTFANGTREEFYMFDNIEALLIKMDHIPGDSIGITLSPSLIAEGKDTGNGVLFRTKENPGGSIALLPFKNTTYHWDGTVMKAPSEAGGFLITYDDGEGARSHAKTQIQFRKTWQKLLQERETRMNDLIQYHNPQNSNLDSLDLSMAWLILTTDELVTHQQGNGIYAGLPWFNEYWGRDMFISMPGAVLCTGQFKTAKSILWDFAQLQQTDRKSPDYGRIPNRANREGIIYNTADGTSRFVMNVMDYLDYTGDTEFLTAIYPAVATSINAELDMRTDTAGYMTHADADTWMDAKRQGRYPCSPRGNRANDIQALWYAQLQDATHLAKIMNNRRDFMRWSNAAIKLKKSFQRDFIDYQTGHIHDHLNPDNSADRQIRPNELYAMEMLPSQGMADSLTHNLWLRLVYPWGVASLDQDDPQFHPYHENWNHYHKDDAYHNGTVWLWNNGIAMQRMIEAGQPDIAWELFRNMYIQALTQGAIGSLPENADAWPRAGHTWANPSGTFLQAWSNAEHIRVWYQDFLGIRPKLTDETMTINPAIPSALDRLQYSQLIAQGRIEGAFERGQNYRSYAYRFVNFSATTAFDIEQYATVTVNATPGTTVELLAQGDRLQVTVRNDRGTRLNRYTVSLDADKVERQRHSDRLFADIRFAIPSMRWDLPSLARYFDPPLDYSSIE